MIDNIANNEVGSSVRGKLNDLIDLTNSFADPEEFIIPVQSRLAILGTTGGAGYLDGIPTVDMTVGTILLIPLVSPSFVCYRLQAGTTAENDPYVVRPDDYAPTTNEKVWVWLDLSCNNLYGDTLVTATTIAGANVTASLAPSLANHVTRKDYVDALVAASAAGLDFKDAVRAATTANITLSGAQTIDGVSVIAGDRVLVKDQSSGAENGIYVAASGAWARSDDANVSAEVTAGLFVMVNEGTVGADTGWILTTNAPITLGSTALTFTKFKPALADDEVTTAKILNAAVTYAKMQDISATQRVLGRNTAGSGDVEEVTIDQLLAWATSSASLTVGTAIITKLRSVPSTLTYAGTTDIDFNDDDVKTITLTGNVTFTTSNRASGKSKKIRVICDSTLRTFTFPSWVFVGAAAPADIAASKTAMLSLDCFGANDTDIVAGYAVQP
jgi:hypothetical protein